MADQDVIRNESGKGEWEVGVDCASQTDIGMRRSNNQDAMAVELSRDAKSWQRRGHIFLVADGMGAHAAGELASKIAADSIPHLYRKYVEQSPPEALQKAVLQANAEIHRRGQANPEFHNMGTTASAMVLVAQGALLGHVGDSRIYRLRGGCFEQLTFDHSLVWEMRAAGQLSHDSELAGMVPKNVITRSLGPNASVSVDVEGPFAVQTGDTFLVCSDGLTGKIEDDELAPVLAYLPPEEATQFLVNWANLRGGPDNITLIVARVTGSHLATEGSESQPLKVGEAIKRKLVHPAVWVVIGVCFLTAVVLLFVSQPYAALAAFGVGAAAVCMALWQRFGGFSRGVSLSEGRRLGRGPYVRIQCVTAAKFVSRVEDNIEDLRSLAEREGWFADRDAFEQLCSQAHRTAQDGDPTEAIRQYGQALADLMSQLRDMQNKATSDSAIDL